MAFDCGRAVVGVVDTQPKVEANRTLDGISVESILSSSRFSAPISSVAKGVLSTCTLSQKNKCTTQIFPVLNLAYRSVLRVA